MSIKRGIQTACLVGEIKEKSVKVRKVIPNAHQTRVQTAWGKFKEI